MYSLNTPLKTVKGVGPKLFEKLNKQNFLQLKDLLLFLPLRYSDRSNIVKIANLEQDKLVTFKAKLKSISGFYKNRRRIDSAIVEDDTGKVKLMWFNNKFISKSLTKEKSYMISGKLNNRGTITQPTIEINKADTIHTGRLVPIYSNTINIPQGQLRRILRHATTQLEKPVTNKQILSAITQLHFPDNKDSIIKAREILALEELLSLIKTSEKIKTHWQNLKSAKKIKLSQPQIPSTIPFNLTKAQKKSIKEILEDLQSFTPMNRMLIGDVGSGKTVVAIIAAQQVLNCGYSVAFIAPTKILAEQHLKTLNKLFPKIKVELLLGGASKKKEISKNTSLLKPKLYLGTHAVINKLKDIKPKLIIYDEQHRFGVKQRSVGTQQRSVEVQLEPIKVKQKYIDAQQEPIKVKQKSAKTKIAKPKQKSASVQQKYNEIKSTSTKTNNTIVTPHILTMSATPIPRSLMLTIFSHLKVSYIDEMPSGRKITKTWIIPEEKKSASYDWIQTELKKHNDNLLTTSEKKSSNLKNISRIINQNDKKTKLAIIVCPFIDPSNHAALENVASAKETYIKIKKHFSSNLKNNENEAKIPSKNRTKNKAKHKTAEHRVILKNTIKIALLHGQMKKDEQNKIIEKLYKNKIDILVTTPIIEVGVDLPAATIIAIESADRFGMASLHQLRGRVGRAGQQGYCLLFSKSRSKSTQNRLKQFSHETNGLKLAELDLKNRGSGDIFGVTQSGFSQLKFASWTNLELITKAKQTYQDLPKNWQSFFEKFEKNNVRENVKEDEINQKPLAN